MPASDLIPADVDPVRARLHRRIDDTTSPSTDQVLGFLTDRSLEVAGRAGDPDTWPADAAGIRPDPELADWARSIVILGASADAWDAAFPEKSAQVQAPTYGRLLYERYQDQLLAFLRRLGIDPAAPVDTRPVDQGLAGGPAGSFPAPLFYRDELW